MNNEDLNFDGLFDNESEILNSTSDNTKYVKRFRNSGLDLTIIRILEKIPGTILAGGALRAVFDGTTVEDYDIFFDKHETVALVLGPLVEAGFIPIYYCPEGKLITLKGHGKKVQLIREDYYDSLDELIEEFDLVPGCVAWEPATEEFAVHEKFDDCTKGKYLLFESVNHPLATMNRIIKYKQKGYQLLPKALYEYCEQVTRLGRPDSNDTDTGVWRRYIE
jgi:hypothetical protein